MEEEQQSQSTGTCTEADIVLSLPVASVAQLELASVLDAIEPGFAVELASAS